jgi:putative transposase
LSWSRATSSSAKKPYGIQRVCRAWKLCRATVQRHKAAGDTPAPTPGKRGPRTPLDDETLLKAIRTVLGASPSVGPYVWEGYRKVRARLRHQHGILTSMRRGLRLMRKHGLLAQQRSTTVRGPQVHDRSIVTERPDRMWAIDATGCMTDEGNATVPILRLVLVDHCTGELLGVRAALCGNRFEAAAPKAMECLREAIRATKGRYDVGVAQGVSLRHDHGSQFLSHAFQDELRTVGISSSPSFVRQPEGNGCVERFIRTLKEQLLWLRRFSTVTELEAALREFRERFNHQWIIGRIGYRTPAQHRRILLGEAA